MQSYVVVDHPDDDISIRAARILHCAHAQKEPAPPASSVKNDTRALASCVALGP